MDPVAGLADVGAVVTFVTSVCACMLILSLLVLLVQPVLSETVIVPVPQMSSGKAPLLFDIKLLIAPATLAASFLEVVFVLLRRKAGTAKRTTSKISVAMANTIMTSIMVKPPDELRCLSLCSIECPLRVLTFMLMLE